MRGVFGDLDLNVLADALKRPGIDPRLWASYALVNRDQPDDHSVEFDPEWGPLVSVTLQPTNEVAMCRVGASLAGNGEGEWHPFMPADEVLVVIPEGDIRAMPVIVARLNNALDKFPDKVSGKDTANNNFGFRRMRGPYVMENDSAILLRSAVTGAMIGIDESGNVTVRNGDQPGNCAFQMGASGFAVQDKDGTGQIVLNSEKGEVTMWWGGTLIKCNGSDVHIVAQNTVNISSSGNTAQVHGISAESVVSILAATIDMLTLLGAFWVPPPSGEATMAMAVQTAGTLSTALPSLLGKIMASPPVTPGTPGVACPGINLG